MTLTMSAWRAKEVGRKSIGVTFEDAFEKSMNRSIDEETIQPTCVEYYPNLH